MGTAIVPGLLGLEFLEERQHYLPEEAIDMLRKAGLVAVITSEVNNGKTGVKSRTFERA